MHEDKHDDTLPSKSAQKKHMHELQALGESLLNKNTATLKQLPISDALQQALQLAKKLKKDNSHRRQRQLIGKLMRSEDAEAIRQALTKQQKPQSSQAEQWLDKLLHHPENLTVFFSSFPNCDRQAINQLMRAAKKEAKQPADGTMPVKQQQLLKHIQGLLGAVDLSACTIKRKTLD
ncbi:MAG: DUF615 domain-containing protein [Cellvibrionaceae bacterium]|nr:DUF615 domain-containing protein [Cellvibrionaceae bacterium]